MPHLEISLSPALQACVAENNLKVLRRRLHAIPNKKAKGMVLFVLIDSKAPLEKFQVFLEAGADTEVKHMHVIMELTPLMFASYNGSDYVETLLRFGAKVDTTNKVGFTALNFASMRSDIAIAKLLLEHGADIKALSKNKECVLVSTLSVGDESVEMLSFLISKDAPIDAVDREGLTPLLHALNHEVWDCVEVLLKAGANPNLARPVDGATPLLCASQHGKNNALEALGAVKLLLNYGADVNLATKNGETPLISFCRFASCAPIVELLLQHGANADAVCQMENEEPVQRYAWPVRQILTWSSCCCKPELTQTNRRESILCLNIQYSLSLNKKQPYAYYSRLEQGRIRQWGLLLMKNSR